MQVPGEIVSGLLALARMFAEGYDGPVIGEARLRTPFTNIGQDEWSEAVRLWNAHGQDLRKSMPERHCPACARAERRNIFTSYDGYSYCECLHCGCWYVPLKVEEEAFERFFELCPAAKTLSVRNFEGKQTEEYEKASLARIGAYLDHLVPLLDRPAATVRYLDIGCGLGHSLQAAMARGLTAVGTESSRECIAIAQRKGLVVRHVSESLEGQSFDLISFWESLEHISEPAEVLGACAKLLADDGLLAFTVPNQNSPLVRLQRADCSVVHGGYDTPGHINLFNPDTLAQLMARSGLSLLYVDGQYGMNPFEFVSYMVGGNRGAFDLLKEKDSAGRNLGFSAASYATIQAVGPALTLLERVLLASPIVYGVACLQGCESRFHDLISEAKKSRRDGLLGQISAALPQVEEPASVEPDQSEELREELRVANERIASIERELFLARNPLQRLSHYLRGQFKRPKD